MKRIMLIASLAAVLAGCSSTPADQNSAPVDERNPLSRTAPGSSASTNAAGTSGLQGAAIGANPNSNATSQTASNSGRLPINDPANILYKRSVFYDYDSFVVKDEFKPIIEAHAKYLRDNKNARITIQGNTDERGGREYNLALGHKRAESVKKMLSILGVQEAQMETISFGKEKPRNPGSDEAAYAENRRSDIVYQGE